uniref:Uncharacterized protein n=1 Tax=Candidatus Kentrum sp. LFY TaxID=2126342 RepID=A0A450U679_9GAMM|nr:MAG: hypothetical protein BECKLFY1418A_GA0070994_100120 [Candidatus Kentron sp. LFY]
MTIMKNSHHIESDSGIGVFIRRAWRRGGVARILAWISTRIRRGNTGWTGAPSHAGSTVTRAKSIILSISRSSSQMTQVLQNANFALLIPNSCFIGSRRSFARNGRKMLVAMALSLPSVGMVNASPSTVTQWPNFSLSDSPLSKSSSNPSFHLSENLSVGADYTENTLATGAEQKHAGISRIAKAYLDYTFFSRRTGNLRHGFQGRLGITNETTSYRDTMELRSPVIEGASLSPSGHFGTSGADAGAYGNFESQEDSSLMASLEWRLNAPGFADKPAFDNLNWGDILQVSFFADYGKAFSHPAISMDGSGRELGVGTGLRFLLPGRFTANFQASYPIDSWESDSLVTNGEGNLDSNGTRFWLDFSYNF